MIDPQEFGELKGKVDGLSDKFDIHSQNVTDGISRIEDLFGDHTKITRENEKDLFNKVDKAHSRIDEVEKDSTVNFTKVDGKVNGLKAKLAVYVTVITGLLTWAMKKLLGE